LNQPIGVAVDGSGNLFIADTYNNVVRRVDAATGVITAVAGNGTSGYVGDGGAATSASLKQPYGVAVDASGNLFIADTSNHVIRRVDATTGVITTVAGDGTSGFGGDSGPATSAELHYPSSVALDGASYIVIADTTNNRVRQVALAPIVTLSATSLTFSTQLVGSTSAAQTAQSRLDVVPRGILREVSAYNHFKASTRRPPVLRTPGGIERLIVIADLLLSAVRVQGVGFESTKPAVRSRHDS
jgi:hypothetical protein